MSPIALQHKHLYINLFKIPHLLSDEIDILVNYIIGWEN